MDNPSIGKRYELSGLRSLRIAEAGLEYRKDLAK